MKKSSRKWLLSNISGRNVGRQSSRETIFPSFEVIQDDPTPAVILNAVNRAMSEIPNKMNLNERLEEDFRLAKVCGFHRCKMGIAFWSVLLGSLLHRELNRKLATSVMRRCDVELKALPCKPWHLHIRVKSLKYVAPFVVCSPKEPTVKVHDRDLKVAFNLRQDDHFIRRLEERTVEIPRNYVCKAQVFACLYRWQYFDPTVLPNGQQALRLWNWCDPNTPLGELWRQLVGVQASVVKHSGIDFLESKQGRLHYLVGYCPFDNPKDSDEFIVLRTLLLPGMDNTPEGEALIQRAGTTEKKEKFRKHVMRTQTMANLSRTLDFSLVHELHNISPQVRAISESVFDY